MAPFACFSLFLENKLRQDSWGTRRENQIRRKNLRLFLLHRFYRCQKTKIELKGPPLIIWRFWSFFQKICICSRFDVFQCCNTFPSFLLLQFFYIPILKYSPFKYLLFVKGVFIKKIAQSALTTMTFFSMYYLKSLSSHAESKIQIPYRPLSRIR